MRLRASVVGFGEHVVGDGADGGEARKAFIDDVLSGKATHSNSAQSHCSVPRTDHLSSVYIFKNPSMNLGYMDDGSQQAGRYRSLKVPSYKHWAASYSRFCKWITVSILKIK